MKTPMDILATHEHQVKNNELHDCIKMDTGEYYLCDEEGNELALNVSYEIEESRELAAATYDQPADCSCDEVTVEILSNVDAPTKKIIERGLAYYISQNFDKYIKS